MSNKALSAHVTARSEQHEMMSRGPTAAMMAGLKAHLAKNFPEAGAASGTATKLTASSSLATPAVKPNARTSVAYRNASGEAADASNQARWSHQGAGFQIARANEDAASAHRVAAERANAVGDKRAAAQHEKEAAQHEKAHAAAKISEHAENAADLASERAAKIERTGSPAEIAKAHADARDAHEHVARVGATESIQRSSAKDSAMHAAKAPAKLTASSSSPRVKAAPRSPARNVELLHKLQDRFQSVAVSSPRSPEHRQAFARLAAARKLAGPEHVEAAAAGRHARTMAAVEKYRTGAEAKLASGNEKITAHEGDRYVRLSKGVPGDKFGGSAHSFVDKTNGDILKADSYKRPAKNARGNVFDKTPENAASAYSAKYMRDLKPAAAPKAAPKNPLSAEAKTKMAASRVDRIHGDASKAIGAEHVKSLLGNGYAFRRGSTVPQIARGGTAERHGLNRGALDALSRAGLGVTFNPDHRGGGPRVGGP